MVAAFCEARARATTPRAPEKTAPTGAASGAAPTFRFKEQFIPGAPLRWQWGEQEREPAKRSQQEPTFRGLWFEELPRGGWDALVLVDSVPRGASMMEESRDYAGRFITEATKHSKDVRVYIYEPWHCLKSGTPEGCDYDKVETSSTPWRPRLAADAPMWDELVADLKKDHPTVSIRLIPAGRALGALADASAAGTVPGFTSIDAFFDDDIHPNAYGKYFIACLHYAALTGESPVGLPVEVKGRWGGSYWNTPNWQKKQWAPPSEASVKRLQEIAWEVEQASRGTAPVDRK